MYIYKQRDGGVINVGKARLEIGEQMRSGVDETLVDFGFCFEGLSSPRLSFKMDGEFRQVSPDFGMAIFSEGGSYIKLVLDVDPAAKIVREPPRYRNQK
jgi:hypothetical protein